MARRSPPRKLVELLNRLGLANEAQFGRVSGYVQRLARDLPEFDSVWIDALAQARVLTPYQAEQINAGRGELLSVGPYVIDEPQNWPAYAPSYLAHHRQSGERVRLIVVDRDSQRLAVSPAISGRSAAECLVHRGRFAPEAVLEIARQMLVSLVALERQGLIHGDICTQGMLITSDGRVVLQEPGLRAILRPEEGYAHADMAPEAYDYLAPERVVEGTLPTVASDIFSCGCVWWHLLTGRPPLPGGDSLAKLRSAQLARIADLRYAESRCFVPDAPAQLTATVMACVSLDRSQRPESMARLAAMLGPPTQSGRAVLVQSLRHSGRALAAWIQPMQRRKRSRALGPAGLVGITCLLAILGLLFAPVKPRENNVIVFSPQRTQRTTEEKKEDKHPPPLRPSVSSVVNDFILSVGKPVDASSLQLRPGLTVRSPTGKRAQIVVPPTGLLVDVDDVRFEEVDFIAATATATATDQEQTLVHLQASRVEFRSCRFVMPTASQRSAILWTHPARDNHAKLSLPSGRVRMSNCVLHGLSVGIDCHTAGATMIELENILCTSTGSVVRFDHFPTQEEPVTMDLSQVTLRETGSLVEFRYANLAQSLGALTVRAQQCVFVIRPDVSLWLFTGNESPASLLENIQWSGQGSLLSPQVMVAGWQQKSGQWTVGSEQLSPKIRPLDDSGMAIAGLVRSEVEFAGNLGDGIAANRVIRWQVPLRSPDPPGADVERVSSGQQN